MQHSSSRFLLCHCNAENYLGLHRIWLFQIRSDPDLAGFRNSNPAGSAARSGFWENLLWDHRTICLLKQMVSAMLSAAIKGSTVQCFLYYVTVYQFLTKLVERKWILYFLFFIVLSNPPGTFCDGLIFSLVNWLSFQICSNVHIISVKLGDHGSLTGTQTLQFLANLNLHARP